MITVDLWIFIPVYLVCTGYAIFSTYRLGRETGLADGEDKFYRDMLDESKKN